MRLGHFYLYLLAPVFTQPLRLWSHSALSLGAEKNAEKNNILARDTHILFFGQTNRKGLGYLDYDFLGADKASAKEIFCGVIKPFQR